MDSNVQEKINLVTKFKQKNTKHKQTTKQKNMQKPLKLLSTEKESYSYALSSSSTAVVQRLL